VLTPGSVVPFDLAHNARSDVHAGSCRMAAGKWIFSGTVTNPANTAASFQIVVDFVTARGDTVLSTTEVDISTIKPGRSANWSAAGAKGKTDVTCVLRQAQTG
jgi:hypothetical protein